MKDFNKDNLARKVVPNPEEEGREIELFVRRSQNLDRVTQAKAEALNGIVKEHDLENMKLTPRQISHLAIGLGLKPRDLIDADIDNPAVDKDQIGRFEKEDALTFLSQNLRHMKSPIAKRGDVFILVKEPKEVMKLQKQL